jgi:hypothetical protein
MAFEALVTLDFDGEATQLGGINKTTRKANPTQVEGYYIGFKSTESKYGPSKLHVFQTREGNVGVWGKSHLDAQLGQVTPGTMVRATFIGTVKSSKGNDMLKYKIEVDKTQCINVVAPPIESAASGTEDFDDDNSTVEELYEDETPVDEVPLAQAKRPTQAAKPNAAKAQSLLGGRRTA